MEIDKKIIDEILKAYEKFAEKLPAIIDGPYIHHLKSIDRAMEPWLKKIENPNSSGDELEQADKKVNSYLRLSAEAVERCTARKMLVLKTVLITGVGAGFYMVTKDQNLIKGISTVIKKLK